MKYYKLNIETDWLVLFEQEYLDKKKELRQTAYDRINGKEFWPKAPVFNCELVHKYEEERHLINWEEESMAKPPKSPLDLKDVYLPHSFFSFKSSVKFIISKKLKEILDLFCIQDNYFYPIKLTYQFKQYDYYFMISNRNTYLDFIDFEKTEFLTKAIYHRKSPLKPLELIKPSEVVKFKDEASFRSKTIRIEGFKDNAFFLSKDYDFFISMSSEYLLSEKLIERIKSENLKLTYTELNPDNKDLVIIPSDSGKNV